jgi:DNA polymerase-3 subunit epsilon
LVKPVNPIPEDAIKIHGITNEMVEDKFCFDKIYSQLNELLIGKKVIIYNANYDIRMINQSKNHFAELENHHLIHDYECAMEKYAIYYGDWNEYRHSYRWQKLPGGDHTALGDCKATLKLLQKMAETEL